MADLDIAALRKLLAGSRVDLGYEEWYCPGCGCLAIRCECAERFFASANSLLDAAEERDALRESLHYANGVADLAMQHRDSAEAERAKLRQYLDDAQDDLHKCRDERDALRAQRDGLLAAAEEVCDYATDLRKRNMELVGVTWAGESPLLVRCRSAVSACKETR